MKAAKKKKQPVRHYLISLYLGDATLHGYLMSDDARQVENAISRITDTLKDNGVQSFVPIWLVTELNGDGVEDVRRVARGCSPEASAFIDKATDFHLTAWGMNAEHPENKRLMQLH